MILREVASVDVVYLNGGTRAKITRKLDCGHLQEQVESDFFGIGADTFLRAVRVASVGTVRVCRECPDEVAPSVPVPVPAAAPAPASPPVLPRTSGRPL